MDLHGINVETAGKEFEAILKNKVREWLSQSYWRKQAPAYAGAQSHDGGAGATYVRLRDRPVSKKSGKTKPDL